MSVFVALVEIGSVSLVFPLALTTSANAQNPNNIERRCLSIADMDARVECLETGVVPSPLATSTQAPIVTRQQPISPTFDCRLAHTSIERAICTDPTLSDWDVRMGRLLQQALQLARDRQSLLDNQRLWLVQRNNNCGAVVDTAIWSCLLEATKARVSSLERAISISSETNQANQPTPAATALSLSPQGQAEAVLAPPSRYPSVSTSPNIAKDNLPRNAVPQDNSTSFPILLVALIAAAIATMVALRVRRSILERKRFRLYVQNLVARFGEDSANRILARQVWQGMTMEQLIESRGHPSDVEQEIKRERIKETWKYQQFGKNRFRERIYLENGIVIGWKH